MSLGRTIGRMDPFQRACAFAWLFFAILSCVATATSLCLTFETDPTRGWWLAFAVAFIFAFGLYQKASIADAN